MQGILAHGAYIPYWRLDRARIGEALGSSSGSGHRAVASYDEDSTTLGVEASRTALAAGCEVRPKEVVLATTSPPYLDKTNATTLTEALALGRHLGAYDLNGSARSGVAALNYAMHAQQPVLAVVSDVRTGLPGGADEREGGDAAAAFLFGSGPGVVAEIVARSSVSAEFLDRWRVPGEQVSRVWEERFGEHEYLPLGQDAVTAALKQAGWALGDVDVAIVSGMHARAQRAVHSWLGSACKSVADDLGAYVGNAGAAHLGLMLSSVLDEAPAGAMLLAVNLADGADVLALRVTDAIVDYRKRRPERRTVAAQIAAGRLDLPYAAFLAWRGQLRREPPRRPDATPPEAPPAARHRTWKFAFTATRCRACGTRVAPPSRVCSSCGAVDEMDEERLANLAATVATYTIDRLAYTPSPPLVVAVVDFDGGGRFRCEMTDADPGSIRIGMRVEMTFRKISTSKGIHNYFWKARPLLENSGSLEEG